MEKEKAHLWAIGFDVMERAEQVRAEIARLAERHCLTLLDVAVAVYYRDGSVTVNGEPLVAAINVRRPTFAGFLAGLALGAPPLTQAAVGSYISASGGAAAEVGISDDFVYQVKAMMSPGSSALFVLDQAKDLPAILHGIQGIGGTLMKTNVDVERAELIQAALAAAANRTSPPS